MHPVPLKKGSESGHTTFSSFYSNSHAWVYGFRFAHYIQNPVDKSYILLSGQFIQSPLFETNGKLNGHFYTL